MYSPVVLYSKVQRRSSTRDGPCLLQTITAPPWNGNRGIVLRRYMCKLRSPSRTAGHFAPIFSCLPVFTFSPGTNPIHVSRRQQHHRGQDQGLCIPTDDRLQGTSSTQICPSVPPLTTSYGLAPAADKPNLIYVVCRASRCGFPAGCTAE